MQISHIGSTLIRSPIRPLKLNNVLYIIIEGGLYPINESSHPLELVYSDMILAFITAMHLINLLPSRCLEPKIGRVYISRDVVFDEQNFPFSKLHENAGARLRKEILLLPHHLQSNSHSIGDESSNAQLVNATDSISNNGVEEFFL
ncbi:hypothetical protein ACJX0J_008180, partial [Zea mays]